LIEGDLIDYASVDLGIVGGITEARKIAGLAETHHVKIATYNPLGPVSAAAALQFNLACPNFGVPEMPPGSGVVNGPLLPGDRPGLGIDTDWSAAAADPVPSRTPRVRRLGGTFTNWSRALLRLAGL